MPGLNAGVCKEGDEASLKRAEAALDLALGLRGWGDPMGDANSAQSTLKFALRIAVVAAGAWPEETQSVGVNEFRKPPCLERFAEVLEVVPGSIGDDKTSREIETGVIVDGEQKRLFRGVPFGSGMVYCHKCQ